MSGVDLLTLKIKWIGVFPKMLKYTDNIFRILHNPWVTHAHFYQKIFTNNKYLTWICNCSQKKRPKKPAVNSVQQYCLYPLPLRLFLCLFLPPSLSLSLPTHALCPLYPLNNTLSLFACVLLFVYPQVCVCVKVIWGFGWAECLSRLHSESISLRCFNTETTMLFCWILDIMQLSFMTV